MFKQDQSTDHACSKSHQIIRAIIEPGLIIPGITGECVVAEFEHHVDKGNNGLSCPIDRTTLVQKVDINAETIGGQGNHHQRDRIAQQ